MIDVMMQAPPTINGKLISVVSSASPTSTRSAVRTMVAPTVTTSVSKRSADMPAQYPTLSPTLSAITAGIRSFSPGITASHFLNRAQPQATASEPKTTTPQGKQEKKEPQ